MTKDLYDVVVIGSGPGGLAAAIAAKKNGADDVLIIERDVELGGILLQCIHNGFGVEVFKEDLPGPGYAQRFINEALSLGIDTLLDTMVLDINANRRLYVTSKRHGFKEIHSRLPVICHQQAAWIQRDSQPRHCVGHGLPRANPRANQLARFAPSGCLHRRHRPALDQCRRIYARIAFCHPGLRRHRHDYGAPPDL
jgi:choline dehydrogenase-like flavoprotein